MQMMWRRDLGIGIGIVVGAALADCVSVPSGGGWAPLIDGDKGREPGLHRRGQLAGRRRRNRGRVSKASYRDDGDAYSSAPSQQAATSVMEMADQFYGDRAGGLKGLGRCFLTPAAVRPRSRFSRNALGSRSRSGQGSDRRFSREDNFPGNLLSA
jgi:hypothetical protein